jgi:hypothetical protein
MKSDARLYGFLTTKPNSAVEARSRQGHAGYGERDVWLRAME